MNRQSTWRRVLGTQADGPGGGTHGRRALVRVFLPAVALALLAPGTAQRAGAQQQKGIEVGIINICKTLGGTVDVEETENGQVTVHCHGGPLDGLLCWATPYRLRCTHW